MARPRTVCWVALVVALAAASCNRQRPAPADASFGITECDRYFQKALACVGKRPESMRPRIASELEQTRTSWLAAAAEDGGSRDDLRTACRTALEALERNAECR
jgi:hypothetical protein